MEISKLEGKVDIRVEENQQFRHYLIFLISQMFSILGSSVVGFLLVLWITYETGSAILLSLSSFFYLIPQIFVTLISGVISDRFNKKMIIFFTDLSQVLVTLSLFLFLSSGSRFIVPILIISALRSMFQALQVPVVKSLIPLMVPKEKISRINGLNYLLSNSVLVISPIIATLLLSLLSLKQVIFIDIFTFILAAIPLFFISIPKLDKKIAHSQ
jgi:DHA3 family macrolide efflux protein-like MFS transporter